MRKRWMLLLIVLVTIGCVPDEKEEQSRPSPKAEVVPDGDVGSDEPRDPAIEESERMLAEVEDAGLDLTAAAISSPAELEELKLRGADASDEPFLDIVRRTILAGLDDAAYVLLFDADREGAAPDLRGIDGQSLIAIERIDRDVPKCTTWVSALSEPDEDLVGYGGRMETATEGICGGIAAMHSFLELGAVNREDVIDGDHFRENPLGRVQGSNRKSMTLRRLQRLHEAAGATTCRMPGGAGFDTSNRGGLERFNRELSGYVNDPNATWDCTLFVRTRRHGKDILAHLEHVSSVTMSGGTASIRTVNGFEQGNQADRVPVNPGENTWESTPVGTPPFSLTGSTARNRDDLVRGIPNVGLVNYLCCRRP